MGKPVVAVLGSGFGGSVFACRLAETGRYQVHLFERGRRYGRNEFPRRPDQLRDAFWDPKNGMYGMFEYRSFPETDIDVLNASGLGGGSLIYANVLYEMPAEFFKGWPGGIVRATLDPYYERVHRMMETRSYPVDQPEWPYAQTPKTQALARAYNKLEQNSLGHPAAKLEYPRLAIQFGPKAGEPIVNGQGVSQTTCIMCGECDVGCNYHAKNTLDLNYLAKAEQCGAEIHCNAEANAVIPRPEGGYRVVFSDPRHTGTQQHLEADYVVVSAGSLGSTHLLLRMRAAGHLVNLSPALGTRWSENGDLLGFSFNSVDAIYPSTGPVITTAIRFFHSAYPDGFPHGLYIEDAGIPNMLAWYLTGLAPSGALQAIEGAVRYAEGFIKRREVNVATDVGPLLFEESKLVSRSMIFLGMGRDRSTGRMHLNSKGDLRLKWEEAPSDIHFERTADAMNRLTQALGGEFVQNPLSYLSKYIAVHPLGGCPMGDTAADGVVRPDTGEVYGHPGLYVADSSIVPTAVGPNPSLTIAALAERFAERFSQQGV